jgi:hypothetical protein
MEMIFRLVTSTHGRPFPRRHVGLSAAVEMISSRHVHRTYRRNLKNFVILQSGGMFGICGRRDSDELYSGLGIFPQSVIFMANKACDAGNRQRTSWRRGRIRRPPPQKVTIRLYRSCY